MGNSAASGALGLSPALLSREVSRGLLIELLELGRVPEGEFEDETDLVWVTGGLGSAHVLRASLDPDTADDRIQGILGRFAAVGLPVSWWVEPEARPEDLGERLLASGLALADRDLGMALELDKLVEPPAVPGLRIERVESAGAVDAYLAAGRDLFGWSPAVASARRRRIVYDERPSQPRRHFLGRYEGRPVAISTVYLRAGLAIIGGVATHPTVRRRGIGACLTAAALVHARTVGYRIAVLQSSEMGRSVYARLGFQPTGHFGRYVTPEAEPMVPGPPDGIEPGTPRGGATP